MKPHILLDPGSGSFWIPKSFPIFWERSSLDIHAEVGSGEEGKARAESLQLLADRLEIEGFAITRLMECLKMEAYRAPFGNPAENTTQS